jgi:hypothetical protein
MKSLYSDPREAKLNLLVAVKRVDSYLAWRLNSRAGTRPVGAQEMRALEEIAAAYVCRHVQTHAQRINLQLDVDA